MRHDHPQASRLGRLPTFLSARHIAVAAHGAQEDAVDTWLRSSGHSRNIAVVVPGYLQALHIAARSDLVAFVPRRLIHTLAPALHLRLVAPPLDPGVDEQYLFYPTRMEFDPGSIWLRQQVLEIGRALERGTAGVKQLGGPRTETLAAPRKSK